MIVLGLTGSIGMGKSTTAGLFAEAGAPVFDADAVVHTLYAGPAVPAVEAAFPGVTRAGRIDRERLAERVAKDPEALRRLEAIVHPLVAAERAGFLAAAAAMGANVVVLDIPLLFEVGREGEVDAVVVVSAPAEAQRARVLARPGMTEDRLQAILDRQLPDVEKRVRADFVIDTGRGIEPARAEVRRILETVTAPGWRGRRGEPTPGPAGRSDP
jgi:dephospho-CoA kinase